MSNYLQKPFLTFCLMLLGLGSGMSAWGAGDSPQPPRIGVVLGGGGARGFAHLGVLQELERLKVPISCIAGTSAGALIGGAYASGMSLDELSAKLKVADWDGMLSGKPARADVPYDRKRDDYKNYFDLTFGMRDGQFRLPRSAINSQEIDLYIRNLVRDRTVDSFDKLPIPFRAVATDLVTGDAVVFDRGSLAMAMRSSMAVPGVFDLVEDHGRLLVDGMLARNVPIQDVTTCADRIIVVDVGTPMLKANEINSLLDVISQTTNIAVNRNVQEQMTLLRPSDIVIRPDLNDVSASDFANNQAIIARGKAAVKPFESRLRALSVSDAEYARWHARLLQAPVPEVDEVKVAAGAGTRYGNTKGLTKILNSENGQPQTVDQVQQKLTDLFATGDYDQLSYSLGNHDGRSVMALMPLERSIGPNYFRFGLTLQSSQPGDASFGVLGSHELTWLNSAGATWRNNVEFGQSTLFKSELYQPLWAGSPVFVAGSYRYDSQVLPLFMPGHQHVADLEYDKSRFEGDVGLALGRYGEARLGVYRSHDWLKVKVGSDQVLIGSVPVELPGSAYTESGIRASLVVDQFDNPRWPRAGYYLNSEVDASYYSDNQAQSRTVLSTAEYVKTFGDVTFRLTGKYRGNLAGPRFQSQPQMLGGFLNLSGYQQDELIGDKVALARLMGYWRVSTLPSAIGSGVYAGMSLESGKVWNELWTAQNTSWLPGGTLFLGADTLLGPFFLGMGYAKGGRLTGYMYLGVDY
ncbi:patatin-like phospholipase family protein [Crenobacter sp. SG2303]|uniref:Patatin-like phospholipase family protein n=1 Tax=Crenobacter oryzisoli TaxID=3056844 RepID=A0ABT7XIL2_9NEIS|nr:patatin-like phospholipase family protein [Crenobacter sp. SG2303]MDN0073568.1 patatin-like phospholipase family protein [Crenobacter sp. SG2303]